MKFRRGARVLVLADDEVLLVNDSDPGIPGSSWWVTPGGGLDHDDEPTSIAAARELHEEAGLEVAPDELAGPVATRVAVHGYSDRVLVQAEDFYVVRVERFDAVPAALTQGEQLRMQGLDWFPLAALPDPVWPADVATIVAQEPGECLDLGVMDESTVPLTADEWERVRDQLSRARLRP